MRTILKGYEMPDVVFLQETHLYKHDDLQRWISTMPEYWSFYNYGTQGSCGTGILIKKNVLFSGTEVIQNKEGRYTLIKGKIYGEFVTLVSIYAPHGDGRASKTREEYLEHIVSQNLEGICFLAGDFNSVINKEIDRYQSPNADINQELIDFVSQNNLVDAFRHINGNEIAYSYECGDRKSRIDTMFLDQIAAVKIKSMQYENSFKLSDHLPFRVKVDFGKILIGHEFWKNKPYFYKEEIYENYFKVIWNKHIQNFKNEIRFKINNGTFNGDQNIALNILNRNEGIDDDLIIENLSLDCKWWENFKEDIVFITRKFQKQHAYKDKKHYDVLRSDYLRTEPGEEREFFCKKMEQHLKQMRMKTNYGQAIDNRVGWERVHSAFFKKCKQTQKHNFIEKLQNQNDDILLDKDEILKNLTIRYKALYKKENLDETNLNFFLNQQLPQIQDENTAPFTLEECKRAIFSMSDNKCPGPDGIRIEFYKKFFHIFGKFYIKFINTCVITGVYPKSWRSSILQPIPKTKDEILSFETLRPLSMTNVDYKIPASMVCERIGNKTSEIINERQTGGVPGRQIQNNTLLLHLLLSFYTTGENERQGYIVSLDNKKAFDMVDRQYLWKVLRAFGFSNFTIEIIKKLYQESSAKVLVNGFLGNTFMQERGVRQGCPMSATLYTIFIEPLARAINNARYIVGMTLPNHSEIRMVQHSDDMTLLMNTRHSVHMAMALVNNYSKLSGATINRRKSFIIHATQFPTNSRKLEDMVILPKNQSRKILGIYYGAKSKNYVYKNWSEIYKKIQDALKIWEPSELSLIGRVLVVNTMAISRLVYLIQTLEYNARWVGKIYKDLITPFLYQNVVQKHVNFLKWPKNVGGLGLVDIQLKSFSLHIRRAKSFLDRPNDSNIITDPVNSILSYYLDQKINSVGSPTRNIKVMNNMLSALNFAEIGDKVPFALFFYKFIVEINRMETRYADCNIKNMSTKFCYKFLNEKIALEDRPFSGKYAFTGYFIDRQTEIKIWEKMIFCKYLDPKIQSYNFKLINKMIPTKKRMFEGQKDKPKKTVRNAFCCICRKNNLFFDETVEHLLLTCPLSNEIWNAINLALRRAGLQEINLVEFFRHVSKRLGLTFYQNWIISETIFILWKNRNQQYYNRRSLEWREVLSKIRVKIETLSCHDRQIMNPRKYNTLWSKLNTFLKYLTIPNV